MTLLAPTPARAARETGPSGRTSRWPGAPLWGHALLLAAVLLGMMMFTRPFEPSISDEGAALAQVHVLAAGEGWLIDHPFPDLDPQKVAFPIDLSLNKVGTDRYAPLAKHPLYSTLLLVPYRVGGAAATFLVSVFGTVLAALGAALLARRIDRRADACALWLTGVASPLFYDSSLLIAHTLAAAAVAFAVLLLTSASARPQRGIASGLVLLLLAELLRNEAVLLGAALGLMLVARGLRAERRFVGLGAMVLAVTLLGYRLDAVVQALVVGKEASPPFTIAHKGNFLSQRVDGFVKALFDMPAGSVLVRLFLVATLALSVAGARSRATGGSSASVAGYFAAAGACSVAAFAVGPTSLVRGLLLASPLVVAGLLMVDRATLRRPLPLMLCGTSALFAIAVVTTQYADVDVAWGWRYFAIGLPLVSPIAAVGLFAGLGVMPRPHRMVTWSAVGVAAAALAAMAAGSLAADHRFAAAMNRTIATATASTNPGDGDPRPVVLSTERATGRLVWSLTVEQRWLTAQHGDVTPFAAGLKARGIKQLVVVTADPTDITAQLSPWFVPREPPARVRVEIPFGRRVVLENAVVVFVARSE